MANKLLEGSKVLSYPLDLASSSTDIRGNDVQYMLIEINDSERSQKLRDDSDNIGGPVFVTTGRSGTGVATEIASGSNLANSIAGRTYLKDADPSLILKYGSEAVSNEKWHTQKGTVRLKRAIVLPMPNEHNVGTSVKYADNEVSLLTKLGDNANALGSDGNAYNLWSVAKNKALGKYGEKFGLSNFKSMMAEERLSYNPQKEVLFEGIDNRQFSFRFQFVPKSMKESDEVRKIIETLRYYALPQLIENRLFYIFPAEFKISFIQGLKDNPNIPKITTAALQRVGVNYSPNSSSWATLPNGAPVAIDLSLEFLELELVDRNRVWNKTSEIRSGY